MSVPDHLDRFRKQLPGCSVAALGDLSARLVLCASHAEPVPRERLDRLCATAAVLLRSGTRAKPRVGVVATALGTEVYVRSPVDDDDVLCCVCGRNMDITALTALAQETLSGLPVQR